MTHEDGNNLVVGEAGVPTPIALYFKSPVEGETVQVEAFSWYGPGYRRTDFCSSLGIETLLTVEATPSLENMHIVPGMLNFGDGFKPKSSDLGRKQVQVGKPNIEILRHDLLPEKNVFFYDNRFQTRRRIMRKILNILLSLIRRGCKHGSFDNTLLMCFFAKKEKKT